MKNPTPIFPGFHLQTLRRKPRSEQHKLADKLALLQRKSFKQILIRRNARFTGTGVYCATLRDNSLA
jgi:hypothetical protein